MNGMGMGCNSLMLLTCKPGVVGDTQTFQRGEMKFKFHPFLGFCLKQCRTAHLRLHEDGLISLNPLRLIFLEGNLLIIACL